jgi:adenylate kinase
MTYKILVMGPQGSGKGTQSTTLSEQLQIPAFAMGQLIRDEAATGSEFGKKMESIISDGNLVSDEDAAKLLKLRLEKPDVSNGYILDGYPRNISQYNAFNFDTPTHVIVIDLPEDESIRRLGHRLTCRGCEKVSSVHDGIKAGDSCGDCGGEWYVRQDDRPEAISRRLEIFKSDTLPVILKYGDAVRHVDGVGSKEEVFERMLKAIQ